MNTIPGYEFTDGDKAKAAPSRFTSAQAVLDVFEEYKRLDAEDARRRAKIRRIYLGYLPYNPDDLRKAGQAWRTNINFKSLANAIDARADAVADLAVDTCNLVTLLAVSPETSGPADSYYARIVEDELSGAIRRDGHVIPALAMMQKEADLTGLGPVTFEDPDSYVPVALERGQVTFDPDGSAVSSDHEIMFVDTVLKATTVFSVLADESLAEKVGWNVAAMRRYALAVFRDQLDTSTALGTTDGTSAEESMLNQIRNVNFQEARQFKQFHVLYVYVRELAPPFKITHIIVPGNPQGAAADTLGQKEFLYVKKNAYDTMDDALVWFPASIAQRYAKAVRGIASTLAPTSTLTDRVTCSMIDSVQRAMSLVLHQKNPGATPMNTLQELGPYTLIGADLEPVPNANQMSNFQSAIQVRGMLEQLGPGSVAGTAMAPTSPRTFEGGQQASKAEAEIMERRRTRRDENQFAVKIRVWDIIISRVCSRFLDLATGSPAARSRFPAVKQFLDRCERRGVTPEILKGVRERYVFQTCRDLVIGSQGILEFLGSVANSISGNTDEVGRKNLSHDIVRYRLGEEAANRYVPTASRDDVPSNETSVAIGENNDIKRGEPAVVGQDQVHAVHIKVHMQVLDEIKQAVEQGLVDAQRKSAEEGGVTQNAEGELAPQVDNPEMLANVLAAMGEHIKQHLAFYSPQLGVKETGADKQVQQVLIGMAPITKALNLAVAEQRRVQEAEQEKEQRRVAELEEKASAAEMEKAKYEIDRKAEVDRYRVDREHEIRLAQLQMQGQEGQERLALEARDRQGRQRLDLEAARGKAALDAAQAEHAMTVKDQESMHNMALSEREAADRTRIEGSRMAERLADQRRVAAATGREVAQPSDVIQGTGGTIPL